jgi:hypothetical protein
LNERRIKIKLKAFYNIYLKAAKDGKKGSSSSLRSARLRVFLGLDSLKQTSGAGRSALKRKKIGKEVLTLSVIMVLLSESNLETLAIE